MADQVRRRTLCAPHIGYAHSGGPYTPSKRSKLIVVVTHIQKASLRSGWVSKRQNAPFTRCLLGVSCQVRDGSRLLLLYFCGQSEDVRSLGLWYTSYRQNLCLCPVDDLINIHNYIITKPLWGQGHVHECESAATAAAASLTGKRWM